MVSPVPETGFQGRPQPLQIIDENDQRYGGKRAYHIHTNIADLQIKINKIRDLKTLYMGTKVFIGVCNQEQTLASPDTGIDTHTQT